MDAERRAEITGWDAREFSDGFAGLRRLVDRGFSGAVTNGTGWLLFVFEGRVVGTADADLDAFADASGTVYQSPAEVLPVLFAMQEQGGEPRAQYYTNDTSLSEADRKLSQGGFTGYIELSENVLSGDYYVTRPVSRWPRRTSATRAGSKPTTTPSNWPTKRSEYTPSTRLI